MRAGGPALACIVGSLDLFVGLLRHPRSTDSSRPLRQLPGHHDETRPLSRSRGGIVSFLYVAVSRQQALSYKAAESDHAGRMKDSQGNKTSGVSKEDTAGGKGAARWLMTVPHCQGGADTGDPPRRTSRAILQLPFHEQDFTTTCFDCRPQGRGLYNKHPHQS
jgi:hypothetical protein